ncbi:MAG: hypothetical protein WCL38_02475, partial [Actinomycetota bacterium]
GSFSSIGQTGIAVTASQIASGQPWNASQVAFSPSYLSGISCPSSTVCVASGNDGIAPIVEWSTNSGSSWTAQSLGLSATAASAVSCSSTTSCVVVGNTRSLLPDGNVNIVGAAFTTADGGTTWNLGALPAKVTDLKGVACPSATTCFAVGYYEADLFSGSGTPQGVIVMTSDGGATWSTVYSDETAFPAQKTLGFKAMSCGSAATCVALGTSTAGQSITVATSTGGANWIYSNTSVDAVSCISAMVCYGAAPSGNVAIGYQPRFFTSDDSGQSWSNEKLLSGTITKVNALSCTAVDVCDLLGTFQPGTLPYQPSAYYSWTPGTSPNSTIGSTQFAANAMASVGPRSWLSVGEPASGVAGIQITGP